MSTIFNQLVLKIGKQSPRNVKGFHIVVLSDVRPEKSKELCFHDSQIEKFLVVCIVYITLKVDKIGKEIILDHCTFSFPFECPNRIQS